MGVGRGCGQGLGRRVEAREGELGGVWPGPAWGRGRRPGRGCGQGLPGMVGGGQDLPGEEGGGQGGGVGRGCGQGLPGKEEGGQGGGVRRGCGLGRREELYSCIAV